jgi:predicted GNAT family N-acyltransferase
VVNPWPDATALNRLLELAGETARPSERWQQVLERSLWHLAVIDPGGQLVGFVRATSDVALNANLWDLLSDPADAARNEVLQVLVHGALQRLRRELAGCSISLSAPPEALQALEQHGFVVDPGGIRAMGLTLQ